MVSAYQTLNSTMEYILNRFLSTKDDKLRDLESGERSGHTSLYPALPPESSTSQMGVDGGLANISTYPTLEPDSQMTVGDGPNTSTDSTVSTQPAVPNYSHSFPMSDAASINTMESTDSMQIETSGGSLPPAEIKMQSDTNQKRSLHGDQAEFNKVRIVAQTSRIPTVVSVCYL